MLWLPIYYTFYPQKHIKKNESANIQPKAIVGVITGIYARVDEKL